MRHFITNALRCFALTVMAASCSLSNAAATTATFDDLAVGPNVYTGSGGGNYWNGPAENTTDEEDPWGGELPVKVGFLESNGVGFINRYNTNYGSWSGFAYSNTSDATTAGYANQYSAYAGSGHSGNYGVAYGYLDGLDATSLVDLEQIPYIQLPNGAQIESFHVTNTTYAALSMLNGDDFAKKFGCTWNATTKMWEDTNAADWFKLTIYGTDADSNILANSVEFYLADYRNINGVADYIVSDWTFLDMSSLVGAERLYFSLSSSDVGGNGMNTPNYFAIDNISFTTVPEPSTFALLFMASVVAMVWRKRRRTQA